MKKSVPEKRQKTFRHAFFASDFASFLFASPQTWVLAMKNPRILRGLRRFYRNDQDH